MKEIKELRELIGVKQPELAELLQLQPSNYSAIEKGYLKPKNLDEIKQKAFAFLELINEQRQSRIQELLKNKPDAKTYEIDINNIAELRKKLNLTQAYMANKINLKQCQYSLLENGGLTLKKAKEYHQKALQILQEKYKATF